MWISEVRRFWDNFRRRCPRKHPRQLEAVWPNFLEADLREVRRYTSTSSASYEVKWIVSEHTTAFCAVSDDRKQTHYEKAPLLR